MSKWPVYYYNYYPEGFNGNRVKKLLEGEIRGHETRESDQYVEWGGGVVYPGQLIVFHSTRLTRAIGFPPRFEVIHAVPVDSVEEMESLVKDRWLLGEVEFTDINSVDTSLAEGNPQLSGLLQLLGRIPQPGQ